MIFQNALEDIRAQEDEILKDAQKKNMKWALDKFFYRVRENADPRQLEVFMQCLAPHKEEQE